MIKDSDRIVMRSKFISENRELVDWLQTNRYSNSFLESMYKKILSCELPFTDKQLQGLKNSMGYMLKKVEQEVVRVELEKVHSDDKPNGAYVGVEKTRYDMTLKFKGTSRTSRGFVIHNFIDKEGNLLMTFSNESQLVIESHSIELGDCFTCKATVNRHSLNEFDPSNKFKQTVLNRIKYNRYLGNKENANVS